MTKFVLVLVFALLTGITLAYPMMAVDGGTIPEPTPTEPGTIPPATNTPVTPQPTFTATATPLTPEPTATEPTALPTMQPPGLHRLYLPWVPVNPVLDDGWP